MIVLPEQFLPRHCNLWEPFPGQLKLDSLSLFLTSLCVPSREVEVHCPSTRRTWFLIQVLGTNPTTSQSTIPNLQQPSRSSTEDVRRPQVAVEQHEGRPLHATTSAMRKQFRVGVLLTRGPRDVEPRFPKLTTVDSTDRVVFSFRARSLQVSTTWSTHAYLAASSMAGHAFSSGWPWIRVVMR